MPEYAKTVRRFPEDPLLSLPAISKHPPPFTPGVRLTQERMDAMGIFENKFLWPEEQLLAAHVLMNNEMALAWNEAEKGSFREDYFPPAKIPMIAHTPWADRTLPIPPGICDKVIQHIRDKIASGLYEPSNSSYRSQWFIVQKSGHICRIRSWYATY
ncbi:hypothetical protein F5890DRAFT_1570793 [Lentinula detonsa]|uniref:DNA/RNA polymerase n=1 Tax=Lentinula detonsa TaxID=2804962 RepID=A0AA38UX91_9AGAR|nr:hypothetical protein F5890DRAFT_1570793 [Lentinula detonsa]